MKLSKIRSSKPGSKRFVLVMTDLASNDPITRRPHLGKRKHSRAKKVGRGKKRRLPDKGEDDTKS